MQMPDNALPTLSSKHVSCPRRFRSVLRDQRGLGILECLIVCAVMAILWAVALPGLKPLLDRSRVNQACSAFHHSILVARSEALRRGVRVDLVPAAEHDWRHGWVVLLDQNNNQQLDAGEPLIQGSEAEIRGLRVESSLRDAGRVYLAFAPSGRPRSASSANVPQIGSLVFSVGRERRKLIISFLGRVRFCDPDRDGSAC